MSQKLYFEKYQATGNDFIIIDNTNNSVKLSRQQIEQLCHRKFGIGADGLILLEKSNTADFKMKYYNSDGGESTFCGNGGRCIAAFAYKKGYAKVNMVFEATDGLHNAKIIDAENVELEMNDVDKITEFPDGYFLDTGSPHFVKVVKNLNNIDVYNEGKRISKEERFFSKTTNVNFVEIEKEGVKIATYERGVENETLSCGTGAIAAAIIFAKYYNPEINQVNIKSKGGKLLVSFTNIDNQYKNIKLTASAKYVFSGKLQ